jgi:hypothetical protein
MLYHKVGRQPQLNDAQTVISNSGKTVRGRRAHWQSRKDESVDVVAAVVVMLYEIQKERGSTLIYIGIVIASVRSQKSRVAARPGGIAQKRIHRLFIVV